MFGCLMVVIHVFSHWLNWTLPSMYSNLFFQYLMSILPIFNALVGIWEISKLRLGFKLNLRDFLYWGYLFFFFFFERNIRVINYSNWSFKLVIESPNWWFKPSIQLDCYFWMIFKIIRLWLLYTYKLENCGYFPLN